MRVVVFHPYTTFEFVALGIPKLWRTMCVSINGPGDPDLWPFDLETGMQVASKVENLLSKFGYAIGLWFLELFAMYATDGQTDGRLQRLLTHSLRAGRNNTNCSKQWWLIPVSASVCLGIFDFRNPYKWLDCLGYHGFTHRYNRIVNTVRVKRKGLESFWPTLYGCRCQSLVPLPLCVTSLQLPW